MIYPMHIVAFLLALLLSVTATLKAFDIKADVPPEAKRFDVSTIRLFSVLIDNSAGGKITIYTDGGSREIGEVVTPATQATRASDGFWASHYVCAQNGTKGAIVASAVNAIHMRCGPKRQYDPAKPTNWNASELSIIPFTEEGGTGDIVVSNPGGYGIFNEWSPYVGNPVYALDRGSWVPLDSYFTDPTRIPPQFLFIDVRRPRDNVRYIEFENWSKGDVVNGVQMEDYGGIYVMDETEKRYQIGRVLQRATQTGRFIGSEYADIGRVRATHPGVLELSTTRWRGKTDDENLRGGVQIVPANHAKYLHYNLGQSWFIGGGAWMIVGPVNSTQEDLKNPSYTEDGKLLIDPIEGLPPIFSGYIRPYFDENNYESSFRFFVSEDFGRTWRTPPEITGVPGAGEKSPVSYWTHIRLMVGK